MKNKIIVLLLVLLMVNIYFWPEKDVVLDINEGANISNHFIVTLTGEVVYPGIYTFYSDITLRNVLDFAGGLTANADLVLVNFNEVISMDKTINILSAEDSSSINPIETYNLNEISKKDLLDLVGVIKGLTLNRAINIILYRQQEGLFQRVEDLLKVKEIGPATYEQIKDYFKV